MIEILRRRERRCSSEKGSRGKERSCTRPSFLVGDTMDVEYAPANILRHLTAAHLPHIHMGQCAAPRERCYPRNGV
jgi:hypothetical protein